MNRFARKITLRVVGIHAAIVLWLMIASSLRGCFKPKEKEIVTFIEFGAPAPAVQVEEVAQMAEPEPPAPEPEPAPIPEPVKVKPKPTPKPKPKPKPEPKTPEKPKWKATKPEDILKGQKVAPSKPEVSADDIKKALSGIASPSAAAGSSDANAAYIASVGRYFDRYWTHPSSASTSESAVYRIYFSKSGIITQRKKVQGSGSAEFDNSVKNAVHAVNSVPRPPSGFPYDYVEVEFRIRN